MTSYHLTTADIICSVVYVYGLETFANDWAGVRHDPPPRLSSPRFHAVPVSDKSTIFNRDIRSFISGELLAWRPIRKHLLVGAGDQHWPASPVGEKRSG